MNRTGINPAPSHIVLPATPALPARVTLTLIVVLALTVILTQAAQAQTYTVIHSFGGGSHDGANPITGLTIRGATLYGTTPYGGSGNTGTVYQLTHQSSGWTFNLLYGFQTEDDGILPSSRVVPGRNGVLYGTSGGGQGYGVVFSLKSAAGILSCGGRLCSWTETPLYEFSGSGDGFGPTGDLVFDQAGNIYGATSSGGSSNRGTVYELTFSGGTWTENVLYSFAGGQDGQIPIGGVIFDQAGNLYGTTQNGGGFGCYTNTGCGTIFQLVPSDSGWTENQLYSFQGGSDGGFPESGVILDSSGNLYGTTSIYGDPGCNSGYGCGGAYKLSSSGGNWSLNMLYTFAAGYDGPFAPLTMDAAGNLYGTTEGDGAYAFGNVFKLSPTQNGWTYTDLYDFTGGSDGANPESNIAFDAQGNLYGTTFLGGVNNNGVVFEITP